MEEKKIITTENQGTIKVTKRSKGNDYVAVEIPFDFSTIEKAIEILEKLDDEVDDYIKRKNDPNLAMEKLKEEISSEKYSVPKKFFAPNHTAYLKFNGKKFMDMVSDGSIEVLQKMALVEGESDEEKAKVYALAKDFLEKFGKLNEIEPEETNDPFKDVQLPPQPTQGGNNNYNSQKPQRSNNNYNKGNNNYNNGNNNYNNSGGGNGLEKYNIPQNFYKNKNGATNPKAKYNGRVLVELAQGSQEDKGVLIWFARQESMRNEKHNWLINACRKVLQAYSISY